MVPNHVLIRALSYGRGSIDFNPREDLSDLAQRVFQPTHSGLSLKDMVSQLNELSALEGIGSEEIKLHKVIEILRLCGDAVEVKFLIRFMMKKLRIGVSTRSIEKTLNRI